MSNYINNKNLLYSILDQGVVSGSNFLTIILGAHYLTMIDQGKLGYIYSIYLAALVFNLSLIYQWSSVKTPYVENKEKYKIFLVNLQLISALITSIILLFILNIISVLSGWYLSILVSCYIFIFLFFQQVYDFARRSSYFFQTSKDAVLYSLANYFLRIVLLVVIRPSSILVFLIILSLSSLFPALYLIFHYRHNIIFDKNFMSDLNNHINEVKYLLLSSPLSYFWGNIPIFICGIILKMDAVGLYTTINSITNIGNIGMELLETEFSAAIGNIASKDQSQISNILKKIFLTGILGWLIAAIIFIYFGKEIIQLIAGKTYLPGETLLLFQWVTIIFIFIFKVDTVWLRSLGDTKNLLVGLLVGFLAAVTLSWPLTSYFKLIGVSLSVTFAALSIAIYQRIILQRKFVISQPDHRT